MYSTTSGPTGVAAPNVALTTSSGAKLAITANAQVKPGAAEARASCDLSLDGIGSLDHQEITVPAGVTGANPGGQSLTLIGAGTASGSGVVRVQCFASAGDVTFSDIRIQAIAVDNLVVQ
jgi:hypothetical protein